MNIILENITYQIFHRDTIVNDSHENKMVQIPHQGVKQDKIKKKKREV